MHPIRSGASSRTLIGTLELIVELAPCRVLNIGAWRAGQGPDSPVASCGLELGYPREGFLVNSGEDVTNLLAGHQL